MYKILLSDNSFIVADEEYQLKLHKGIFKKNISIKEYLAKDKYHKYYLLDLIDGKKENRTFTIEKTDDLDMPIGSRIKLAKDIQIGDLVMGKDGASRKVKELHTGEDEMFEITVNGKSYTVNGGHILALVDRETGEHLEMPVNVYMHLNEEFHSKYVMEVETTE